MDYSTATASSGSADSLSATGVKQLDIDKAFEEPRLREEPREGNPGIPMPEFKARKSILR